MSARWSRDKYDQLTRLASRGLTASQIAERMKVSRNAVIGKCWREGIALPMDDAKRSYMAGLARDRSLSFWADKSQEEKNAWAARARAGRGA